MRALVLTLVLMILSGCASGDLSKSGPVIRYINMQALVDNLASDDPDWDMVSSWLKNQSVTAAEKQPAADSEKIKKKADEIRKKVYPLIERALREVARRNGIDFVLTLSEGVVYSDSRFDMTGEVLSEARSMKIRSGPLSR
jgi:hypothetical protein